MILFENPVYALSTGTLLFLAVLGLYKIFMILKHKTFLDHKDLQVFRVDLKEIGTNIDVFVRAIKPPFTLEIAIEHLGKDKNYYLIVPKSRARSLASSKGLHLVKDYNFFRSGGEHLGAYFKDGLAWPEVSLEKINFSKVNEVGEGAVVQFVFGRKKQGKTSVNLRIAASASSVVQAREIMNALKGSFSEYNSVDATEDNFMHIMNAREFDPSVVMFWGVTTK